MKSSDWSVIKAATEAGLPDPGFDIDSKTAIVITDPQNDFLRSDGVAWPVVKASVHENNTISNMSRVFQLAKENNMKVFISPHYFFPTDKGWKFDGALEKFMHSKDMYKRTGRLDMTDFEDSGADFLDEFKKYISQENIILCNPHKIYGPQTTDLNLQLRKYKIEKVLMAGMSTNLCLESHTRQLIEEGFEVAVIADASASAKLPGLDTFQAALMNLRMITSHVFTTEEFEAALKSSKDKNHNIS
ncbi:MAG: nicotinamidase-related amidase [Flavobacterium sp.]|jgi:nicotinamidase-related amidase